MAAAAFVWLKALLRKARTAAFNRVTVNERTALAKVLHDLEAARSRERALTLTERRLKEKLAALSEERQREIVERARRLPRPSFDHPWLRRCAKCDALKKQVEELNAKVQERSGPLVQIAPAEVHSEALLAASAESSTLVPALEDGRRSASTQTAPPLDGGNDSIRQELESVREELRLARMAAREAALEKAQAHVLGQQNEGTIRGLEHELSVQRARVGELIPAGRDLELRVVELSNQLEEARATIIRAEMQCEALDIERKGMAEMVAPLEDQIRTQQVHIEALGREAMKAAHLEHLSRSHQAKVKAMEDTYAEKVSVLRDLNGVLQAELQQLRGENRELKSRSVVVSPFARQPAPSPVLPAPYAPATPAYTTIEAPFGPLPPRIPFATTAPPAPQDMWRSKSRREVTLHVVGLAKTLKNNLAGWKRERVLPMRDTFVQSTLMQLQDLLSGWPVLTGPASMVDLGDLLRRNGLAETAMQYVYEVDWANRDEAAQLLTALEDLTERCHVWSWAPARPAPKVEETPVPSEPLAQPVKRDRSPSEGEQDSSSKRTRV